MKPSLCSAPRNPSTVADNLRAAKALIKDPKNWCRNAWNSNGKYCAIGAIEKLTVWSNEERRLLNKAAYAFKTKNNSLMGTMALNNNHPQGHMAVMAMFDAAIAFAEAGL